MCGSALFPVCKRFRSCILYLRNTFKMILRDHRKDSVRLYQRKPFMSNHQITEFVSNVDESLTKLMRTHSHLRLAKAWMLFLAILQSATQFTSGGIGNAGYYVFIIAAMVLIVIPKFLAVSAAQRLKEVQIDLSQYRHGTLHVDAGVNIIHNLAGFRSVLTLDKFLVYGSCLLFVSSGILGMLFSVPFLELPVEYLHDGIHVITIISILLSSITMMVYWLLPRLKPATPLQS